MKFPPHDNRPRAYGILLCVFLLLAPSISWSADQLIVYSGRAERLIKPVLDAFQSETGIRVQMLTGKSTQLINRLQAEGPRTPADVFITNDAGTLERARELHLLQSLTLPGIEKSIPATFRAPDNSWIGLSGRVWVVVYNTKKVNPSQIHSLLDLADPKWKGKIAIPQAGSEYLQTGVSVIRAIKGDKATKQFLRGIKANAGNSVYGKNRQIVDAVARGEVSLGIVNHYYIYRHLAKHPDAPIALLLTDQADQGIGLIMNASGIGVTAHSSHVDSAKRLVQFLIAPKGQKMFADLNKEYPLNPSVKADSTLPQRETFQVAAVPLTRLAELRDPTMTVIEDIGLR